MTTLDKTSLRKRLGTLGPETVEALADAVLGALGISVEV
jgi:mRNA-degrading endonuclease toxin of MazEF toxin-antitoxin module